MNNDKITEYLNDYIKIDNPQYAVMITGKWGCGKTYYIKSLIANWEKQIKDKERGKCCYTPYM